MMQHHVYFWLKDECKTPEHRAAFETALDDLLAIEQIADGIWGPPAPTPARPVMDHSWDYGLSLTFPDVATHDAYQDHAAHHAFVDGNKHLWAKVLVMDVDSARE